MNYNCKECGANVECFDFKEIIQNRKLCLSCRHKNDQEKHKKVLKSKGTKVTCKMCDNEFLSFLDGDGNQIKKFCSSECRKNSYKNKEKILIVCVGCGKEFLGHGAKYCSTECRKKGIQNKHFYKDLKLANQAIYASKIKVFGAHKERHKGYINEKSRKHIK